MAWMGRNPIVDEALPPGGPVTSSEPVLGGAEGVSPTAKLVWDLARALLSQNPATTAGPVVGVVSGAGWGGIGNPGGWRYPPVNLAPLQYRNLLRHMNEAGGTLKGSPSIAQAPIDVEGLQMLGLKARPGRPALSPMPPLLAQPLESGPGRIAFGRIKTGEYDRGGDLFFDLIKQLFRRGVEQR